MEPISAEGIRETMPTMNGRLPSDAFLPVAELATQNGAYLIGYVACAVVALAYFGPRLQEEKDILCTACAAISAHALQIDDSFVGLAAALAAGYLVSRRFSLRNWQGSLGLAAAYCCFQAGFPLGACVPALVGYYAGKGLELGSYRTAGIAAVFFSLAATKYCGFFALVPGEKLILAVLSKIERPYDFLNARFGEWAALTAMGGVVLTAAYTWYRIVSSLTQIAAIRAVILVIQGEIVCEFYHRFYIKSVKERMQRIVESSLHTWVMEENLSAHLVKQQGKLRYFICSSVDDQIIQEGNIPLPLDKPSDVSIDEAVSHLRNCYLELIPGRNGRLSPKFSLVKKIWEFPGHYGYLMLNGSSGITSLHTQRLKEGGIAYQWRWGDTGRTYSYWTDPFVLTRYDFRNHKWWPGSECLPHSMVWPDEDNIVNCLRNYHISVSFSSWRERPVPIRLDFSPGIFNQDITYGLI